jgi:hypothetical protein
MPEQMKIIACQTGPLEDGGEYASFWVEPRFYEDRKAPHITHGPVPFKMDCDKSAVLSLLQHTLPVLADCDNVTRVASGNKAKTFCLSVTNITPADKPTNQQKSEKVAA